jgi:hypothetical protein
MVALRSRARTWVVDPLSPVGTERDDQHLHEDFTKVVFVVEGEVDVVSGDDPVAGLGSGSRIVVHLARGDSGGVGTTRRAPAQPHDRSMLCQAHSCSAQRIMRV